MENQVLLDIARKSIAKKFDSNIKVDKEKLIADFPQLKNDGATFVTLNLDGELRGCIGSLQAHRSLIDDLTSNAYAAAFEDPRFLELTAQEFEKVDVEISILSSPVEIQYSDLNDLESKIKPNIHGVILEHYGKRSTFLPQVWEQLPSFEEFFSHLIYKGSFDDNLFDYNPKVFVYEVRKIK